MPGLIVDATVIRFTYLPLTAGGARLDHGVDQQPRVLRQLNLTKFDFAHRSVNNSGLIDSEFHLTGFDFLDGLRHVKRDGSGLRVGASTRGDRAPFPDALRLSSCRE